MGMPELFKTERAVQLQSHAQYIRKLRLECIGNAINALFGHLGECGITLDAYPPHLLAARSALWRAYYAEEAAIKASSTKNLEVQS